MLRTREPLWRTTLIWASLILTLNLLWYGYYLSFPLVGEDGAAAYSSLIEILRFKESFGPAFSVKWLEGLGQLNILTSLTFDPFSWLMLGNWKPANAFRVSYALRATVSWVATYLLVTMLFRGDRWIGVLAAWVSMLAAFMLPHTSGVPTSSVMHIATQIALFPILLWLHLCVVRQRGLIGWADGALLIGLVMFLPAYPIGSLLGIAVLHVFGLSVWLTARRAGRRAAGLALGKLLLATVATLFTPVIGLYHTWSAIATVSARNVFARELTAYPAEYVLPQFWHGVPLGVRIVVLLALAVVLVRWRWPRPLRMAAVTLALVVLVSQVLTLVRWAGVLSEVTGRLPRPSYLEFYLPCFYAICCGYTLRRWRRLLTQSWGTRTWWPLRITGFNAASWVVVGGVVLWWPMSRRREAAASILGHRALRCLPEIIVLTLLVGAIGTWAFWPEGLHPVFAEELLCKRQRSLWCRDEPGRTMGAARSPITEFLRSQLSGDESFRGRADYLLANRFDREDEVWIMVQERNRNFHATGNGMVLRALPFQGIPVASSYEQALDYLYYLFWTRYVNGGVLARRSINMTNLESLRQERLALIGVRYVIANGEWYDFPFLVRVFAWKGYSVYAIDGANTGGYAIRNVVFGKSLAEELRLMRDRGFNPQQVAVMAETERERFEGERPLSPMGLSRLTIQGQSLHFEALSGGLTLVVLPFKFSHCWRPLWAGSPGRIVRVNVALVGVVFERAAQLRLSWSAGYGPWAECLRRDAELIPEAVAAAAELR